MARIRTCGWETGYVSGSGSYPDEFSDGSSGGFGTEAVVANPAWWSSSGNYVFKLTGARNATSSFFDTSALAWVGFKFGIDALPGSDTPIFGSVDSANGQTSVVLKTTGKLELWTGTSPPTRTLRGTSTITLAIHTCYLIEIKVVAGDVQVWVNGGLEISDTNTTESITGCAIGSGGMQGGGAVPLSGWVTYWDDFYENDAVSTSSNQTGRRGAASVMPALSPNADNGSAPAGTWGSDSSYTWGNATTGWFSAVNDPPGAINTGNYISKGSADNNRAFHDFANSPGGAAPTVVRLVALMGAFDASSSADDSFRGFVSGNALPNGGTSRTWSAPGVYWKDYDHQPAGLSSIAWTKTALDAFVVGYGDSADVSPNPFFYAFWLQFEQLDGGAAPVTDAGTEGITIGASAFANFDAGNATVTIGMSATQSIIGGTITDSGNSGITISASAVGSGIGTAVDTGNATIVVSASSTQFVIGSSGTPNNTTAPIASGTARTGRYVQCHPGVWSNDPTAYTFQWQRDVARNGVFSNIGGETNHYHVCVAGDVGNNLRCVVTGINTNGTGGTGNSNVVKA